MVKASTIATIGIIGGATALGYYLLTKEQAEADDTEPVLGKFDVLYAGSVDTVVGGFRIHKFQFRENGALLGNEDVHVLVETVFTKKKIIDRIFSTPASDEPHELGVSPNTNEAVNIYLTRIKTGEKFWFQCIRDCGKISGG